MAHRKLAIFGRRLFTALSVLSLLLCVATLVLWVRSYWRVDVVTRLDGNRWIGIQSAAGHFDVSVGQNSESISDSPRLLYYSPDPNRTVPMQVFAEFIRNTAGIKTAWFLGFGYLFAETSRGSLRGFGVPDWFLALLFAILPALRLRAAIRSRRRRRAGHCPRCGYDLRATPERCPECGHLTAETQSTQSKSAC